MMSLVQCPTANTLLANTDTKKKRTKDTSVRQIKPIIKLLSTEGISPAQLLDGTGIQLSDLALFNSRISYPQYFKLIENAYFLAPDPTFAMKLGEQVYVNHDGILVCRIMSCQNASQAMQLLTEYQSLLTQLFHLDFNEEDNTGIFSIMPNMSNEICLPFFIESIFASIYSLGKFCTGLPQLSLQYEFTYDGKAKQQKYEAFFGQNIKFNCQQNRVLIPNEVLSHPFIFENQKTAQENDKMCKDKLRIVNQNTHIIEQVKMLIIKNKFTNVSLQVIAEQLCMSPRTLRRHLNTEHITYKSLLESERKRVVIQSLTQNTPIKKVAEQVGYADASSFSRAFKKWFGIPPHLYQHQDHVF